MTHGQSSRGSAILRTFENLEPRTLFSDIAFVNADFNDIAYDSTGALHVAYYDTSTSKLMYAVKPNGGSWSTPISITNATGVGTYVAMAVDSTNGIGVVYADDTNADLLYAYKPAGGSWPTTASTIRTSYCMYTLAVFRLQRESDSRRPNPKIEFGRRRRSELCNVVRVRSPRRPARRCIHQPSSI
jgi:hypothetical protein